VTKQSLYTVVFIAIWCSFQSTQKLTQITLGQFIMSEINSSLKY